VEWSADPDKFNEIVLSIVENEETLHDEIVEAVKARLAHLKQTGDEWDAHDTSDVMDTVQWDSDRSAEEFQVILSAVMAQLGEDEPAYVEEQAIADARHNHGVDITTKKMDTTGARAKTLARKRAAAW